jgi:hypothetical protein
MNSFGDRTSTHSIWSMILTMYNLPTWEYLLLLTLMYNLPPWMFGDRMFTPSANHTNQSIFSISTPNIHLIEFRNVKQQFIKPCINNFCKSHKQNGLLLWFIENFN